MRCHVKSAAQQLVKANVAFHIKEELLARVKGAQSGPEWLDAGLIARGGFAGRVSMAAAGPTRARSGAAARDCEAEAGAGGEAACSS